MISNVFENERMLVVEKRTFNVKWGTDLFIN